MAKTPTAAAATAAPKTGLQVDYDGIGRAYVSYRRFERAHDQRRQANPHDPNVGFGRTGELTVERDNALAALRVRADAVIEGGGE